MSSSLVLSGKQKRAILGMLKRNRGAKARIAVKLGMSLQTVCSVLCYRGAKPSARVWTAAVEEYEKLIAAEQQAKAAA